MWTLMFKETGDTLGDQADDASQQGDHENRNDQI